MKLSKPVGEECPDCTDGYLVERVNSNTKNTFIGCSEWPDCEFTKRGGKNPSPVKVGWSSLRDELDYDDDDRMDWDWMDGEF